MEGTAPSTSATGTTVYDRLGARPVVNCRGVYSELGGAIISPDVWAAMTEAAGMAASMAELLEATGRRLAQVLGAEAARVTPGAAAGIALGTAACLTRGDGAATERLPDTTGLPDEVLLQRVQRPNYKYARLIWMTGAKLRLVGTDEATSHEDLEQALDPERVAAVFVPAHLDTGGFVVGRSDLVDAVAVVDFTGFESGRWATFGRPFKLDLHTVVGTVLAVEEWMEFEHEARWRAYAELVDELAGAVEGIPGVRAEPRSFTMVETLESEPVNCLVVHVDAQEAGVSAADVERSLHESNPRVAVHRWDDTLIVAVDTMLPEHGPYVCERLRVAFSL